MLAFFFFNGPYLVVVLAGLVLGIGASLLVRGAVARWRQVPSRSGLTGAQVAQAILQANGIHDVNVERVPGELTDHYDPRDKTLRLSELVYGERSIAALGIAAHEVGHAIQHAQAYAPLRFRSAWVPMAGFGTQLGIWVIIAALAFGGFATGRGTTLAWVGLAMFGCSTVFTLVTLPVEFDASRRALVTLQQSGVLAADEMPGARQVLRAAGLTYVAAFVSSLLTLLYWAYELGLFGDRRRN